MGEVEGSEVGGSDAVTRTPPLELSERQQGVCVAASTRAWETADSEVKRSPLPGAIPLELRMPRHPPRPHASQAHALHSRDATRTAGVSVCRLDRFPTMHRARPSPSRRAAARRRRQEVVSTA